MTTAKTRRPPTPTGPQRGANAKSSGRTTEPIPVLIRLPELNMEPNPETGDDVREQDTARLTVPLIATPPNSGPSIASHIEAPPASTEVAASEQSDEAIGVPLPSRRLAPWSELRLPPWAVHGGIAIGLVAVLVIAYLAIVGRSPSSETAVTDTGLESPAPSRPSGVPSAGLAAPPALDFATEQDTGHKTEQQPVRGASSALEKSPAVHVGGGAEQKPAETAESPTPSLQAPQTASPQEMSLEQPQKKPEELAPEIPQPTTPPQDRMGTDTATTATTAVDPTRQPAAAPADTETNLPLTSGPTADGPNNLGNVYNYPVTNPATFQYPPDYHEYLRPQAADPGSQNSGPTARGVGPYDGRPSTARLQPPIDPPPMR